MEKYIDKSGLFEDFNFKLVVIEALLELDEDVSFKESLTELAEKHGDDYEWYSDQGPIKEVVSYIEDLHINQEELDQVTEICFDGGCEIYALIQPDWDGEDDYFDVTSIKGYEYLTNLETVDYVSMIEEDLLEPMTEAGITIE